MKIIGLLTTANKMASDDEDEEYVYLSDDDDTADDTTDDTADDLIDDPVDEPNDMQVSIHWVDDSIQFHTKFEYVTTHIVTHSQTIPKSKDNRTTELYVDRCIELYIKQTDSTWDIISHNTQQFLDECMEFIHSKYHKCVCCGEPIYNLGLFCCTNEACKIEWVEKKYYPSLANEFQQSKIKVEFLLNIIYWGLFADLDKERIMENFKPFPSSLCGATEEAGNVDKEIGSISTDTLSYTFIKDAFDSFLHMDAIDTICSSRGHHHMRQILYDFDLIVGHQHDTFEWLLSSTFINMEVVNEPSEVLAHWACSSTITNYTIFKLQYKSNDEALAVMETIVPEKVYHGTKLHCVHSILKNGLITYSHTKNQIHGAVYGNGIYTSTNFNESYGYCSSTVKNTANKWEQSNMNIKTCMFLCDYYQNPIPDKHSIPPSFRIARENKYVIPRYLWVEFTVG